MSRIRKKFHTLLMILMAACITPTFACSVVFDNHKTGCISLAACCWQKRLATNLGWEIGRALIKAGLTQPPLCNSLRASSKQNETLESYVTFFSPFTRSSNRNVRPPGRGWRSAPGSTFIARSRIFMTRNGSPFSMSAFTCSIWRGCF